MKSYTVLNYIESYNRCRYNIWQDIDTETSMPTVFYKHATRDKMREYPNSIYAELVGNKIASMYLDTEDISIGSDIGKICTVHKNFLREDEIYIPFGEVLAMVANDRTGYEGYVYSIEDIPKVFKVNHKYIRGLSEYTFWIMLITDYILSNSRRTVNDFGIIHNTFTGENKWAPFGRYDECLLSTSTKDYFDRTHCESTMTTGYVLEGYQELCCEHHTWDILVSRVYTPLLDIMSSEEPYGKLVELMLSMDFCKDFGNIVRGVHCTYDIWVEQAVKLIEYRIVQLIKVQKKYRKMYNI